MNYADLANESTILVEIDEDSADPDLYTFDTQRQKKQVGQPARPLGIKDIVTGAPLYSADVPMKDVLFGRAVRPPVHNAKIETVDTNGVNDVPGFLKLVQEDNFVGVICKTPGSVNAAMSKLSVNWQVKQPINQEEIDRLVDVDRELADGDLENTFQSRGTSTRRQLGI